uniref:GPN-loop GTPase n=1 Tax=Spermophilus dauricus TaxID=99837 RepID=A0A8C9Q3F7_SPEDA
MAAPVAAADSGASGTPNLPLCLLVLGMAGSRKNTFLQRLKRHLNRQSCPPYVINLDLAMHEVPFPPNIRDTV